MSSATKSTECGIENSSGMRACYSGTRTNLTQLAGQTQERSVRKSCEVGTRSGGRRSYRHSVAVLASKPILEGLVGVVVLAK